MFETSFLFKISLKNSEIDFLYFFKSLTALFISFNLHSKTINVLFSKSKYNLSGIPLPLPDLEALQNKFLKCIFSEGE